MSSVAMLRRVTLATVGLICLALIAGGAALIAAGVPRGLSIRAAVGGYFSALQRADAPKALSYGDLPDAPHPLLTDDVLRVQQRIAPIHSVVIDTVNQSGRTAEVAVTYVLAYPGYAQHVRARISLHSSSRGWRLDAVAVPTALQLSAADDRATVQGAAIPDGQTLLFPGAVPVTFDSDYLQLVAGHSAVGFGAPPLTEVQVGVSAAGKQAVTSAVTSALSSCIDRPSANSTCPLPTAVVPGSLRGRVTSDVGRVLKVALAATPTGDLVASGSVDVAGTYEQLAFDNMAEQHSGDIQVPFTATMVATRPLKVAWSTASAQTVLDAPGPAEAPEYWFDQWQVPALWQAGARGQGVVIGELDTGVNAQLPALAGKILPGKDFGSLGGDGRTDRDVSSFGHGTAMASLMVASPGSFDIEGLAPAAKILPVALPLSGTADPSGQDDIGPGIRWAVDHGATIISMSIGASRAPGTDASACPSAEQSAVNYALSKGVILLAAVGNDGTSAGTVEAPAVCLGVIAVGAVDESGTIANFSSRERYVAFAAPGVDVPSLGADPGTAYHGDGTSQATAIAAAVAALVWSKYPHLTASQVVARLLATLDRKASTPSSDYGYGLLNASRAVLATVPTSAPNAIYDRVEPFLQRAAAVAKAAGAIPSPPQPPSTASTGRFRVDRPPASLSVVRIVIGCVLVFDGLLGLVILLLIQFRRAASQLWIRAP